MRSCRVWISINKSSRTISITNPSTGTSNRSPGRAYHCFSDACSALSFSKPIPGIYKAVCTGPDFRSLTDTIGATLTYQTRSQGIESRSETSNRSVYVLVLSTLVVLCCPIAATAQSVFPSTDDFLETILTGKSHLSVEAKGDLNGDGLADWAGVVQREKGDFCQRINSTFCCGKLKAAIASQRHQPRLQFPEWDVAGSKT